MMNCVWTLGGIFLRFSSRSPWQGKSRVNQNTVSWQRNQHDVPETLPLVLLPLVPPEALTLVVLPLVPLELRPHGVQARGRLEHQEDNSAVESLPRVLDGLGSLQGSIETSLESTSLESTVSTPLVPAVIPTPRRTSTPTVSRVLEPLYRTPVETANDSGSQVMEQLQAFFARQGDFNRRLEERLEGHLQGQGRENRPTAQATRFSKALSVSHLSS